MKKNYRNQFYQRILLQGETRTQNVIEKWQITDEGRICRRCHNWKKWEKFSIAKEELGGHLGICKDCQKLERKTKLQNWSF